MADISEQILTLFEKYIEEQNKKIEILIKRSNSLADKIDEENMRGNNKDTTGLKTSLMINDKTLEKILSLTGEYVDVFLNIKQDNFENSMKKLEELTVQLNDFKIYE